MTWAARIALLGLAILAVGCGDPPARPDVSARHPSDPAMLARARSLCDSGHVADGLAAVDSVLDAEQTADALVVRAMCRWVEYDSTGAADVGGDAEEDLTSALAQARVDDADDVVLAQIYSHRAALRRALGDQNWPSTLADLNAAIDADTSQPLYVLDRAVARMRRGDSAAAVLDLDRYLQLDTVNTARGDLARQLRDEVQPRAGRPLRAE